MPRFYPVIKISPAMQKRAALRQREKTLSGEGGDPIG
jgi:hypothetical protein